jgi:hypothetical protein
MEINFKTKADYSNARSSIGSTRMNGQIESTRMNGQQQQHWNGKTTLKNGFQTTNNNWKEQSVKQEEKEEEDSCCRAFDELYNKTLDEQQQGCQEMITKEKIICGQYFLARICLCIETNRLLLILFWRKVRIRAEFDQPLTIIGHIRLIVYLVKFQMYNILIYFTDYSNYA